MTVSREQAEQLASLAVAARPSSATRWDVAGVMAALAKVRHLDLAELVMAVGRAAGDRSLRTPAPIGDPSSSCWRERNLERVATENRKPDPWNHEDFCATCGKRSGHQHPVDHEFESAAMRARKLSADDEPERVAAAIDWARQGIGDAKAENEMAPEPEPLPSLPEVDRLRAQLGGRPDAPAESVESESAVAS